MGVLRVGMGVGGHPPHPTGVSRVGYKPVTGSRPGERRVREVQGSLQAVSLLAVGIHARNDDCAAPGTSEAQHIGFLGGDAH